MDNTLWHYGDSFGTWYNDAEPERSSKKGFTEYIAEHFNLNFKHRAEGGISNTQILSRIIYDYNKFKPNDFIIINWTFFSRTPIIIKPFHNNNITTICFGDNTFKSISNEKLSRDYLNHNIITRSDFQEEEWNLLFWSFLKPTMENLKAIGVKVYISFNNNVLNDKSVDIQRRLTHGIDIGNVFTYDYIGLLNLYDFFTKEDEDVHYKFGVQDKVAEHWITFIESNE